MEKRDKSVKSYYRNLESRIGYKVVLGGIQHFGYYPNNKMDISEDNAQKHHHDLLVKKLNLKTGKSLLDAGCGQGLVAIDLAIRYGYKVTGIDVTPYIVKTANKNKRKLPKDISKSLKFEEMSFNNLEFDKDSFDGIYTVETLSHSPDLKNSIKNLYSVLKPGGHAVFFEYKVAEKEKFTDQEWKDYELVRRGSAMHSLNLFRKNNFIKALEETGFRNIIEQDISTNAAPSLKRLYKIARIPYFFVKMFKLKKYFINTTCAVEYYEMADKGLLKYFVYSATKVAKSE